MSSSTPSASPSSSPRSQSPTSTSETESTTSSSAPADSFSPQKSSTSSSSSTSSKSTYTSDHSYHFGSKCVNCMDDVPSIGIMCAAPECKEMRLCVECFSSGAELGPHKVTHKYKFFHSGRCEPSAPPRAEASVGSPSIISTRTAGTEETIWYEEEQIRLLKGLELFGYGNWSEIANHVATKTAQEAKEEYINRYINGPIGQLTWGRLNDSDGSFPIDHTVRSHTSTNHGATMGLPTGPLSPGLTSKLPPLEASKEEMRLLGVMPKRDDYEREWKNDAEQLISNLSFNQDDDEIEIGMKLALVDMYTMTVRERAKRKKVVRDHQLVAEFFKTHKAKQSSASAKGPVAGTSTGSGGDVPSSDTVDVKEQLASYRNKVEHALRPFAQFISCRKDYDTLIGNLVYEQELKLRLQILKRYREMGFRTNRETHEHESLRKQEASKSGKPFKKGLEPISESENEGTQQGEGDEQSDDGDGEGERSKEAEDKDDSDESELLSIHSEYDVDSPAEERVTPDCIQDCGSSRVKSMNNKKGPASSLAKSRRARKRKPRTKLFARRKSHTPEILEMRRKVKLQKGRSERRRKLAEAKTEHRLTTTRSGRVAKRTKF